MIATIALGGCRKKDNAGGETDGASSDQAGPSFDASAVETFNQQAVITNAGSDLDLEVQKPEQDEDLNQVLPQCGIDDLSDRNRKTFETIMKYDYVRLINAGIAVATVPLTSVLDLSGTLALTTLNVGVEVGSVSGESELAAVTDVTSIDKRAETLAASFRGPATAFSVPRNSNFGKDWKGILCTITGANRMENKRGGYFTESTFKTPFAPNISPIAVRKRYVSELGDFRYFRNIEATVVKTDNPLLTVGKTYTGSILVEKIPHVKETAVGTIRGDTAYRVTNRFGTDQETLALGFHLWTEYYIDHGQKSFSAVIANVGDEDIMHFIGKYVGDGEGQ
jgi:hypothetical protein